MESRTQNVHPPTAGPVVQPGGGVQPTPPLRRGNPRLGRILLLAFIISPLAVLTLLCILIARSLEHGRLMTAPPVGAGAGKTGMSNEFMHSADRPAPRP